MSGTEQREAVKARATTGPGRSAHMCDEALAFSERPDQTSGPASATMGLRIPGVSDDCGHHFIWVLSDLIVPGVRTGVTGGSKFPGHIYGSHIHGKGVVPSRRAAGRRDRPGSIPEDAVQALLRGPTSAEYKLGYRTFIPAGTNLRSVSVANGQVTVDLSLPFALGDNGQDLDARLSQLVHTATGFDGVTKVQLLVNGGTVFGMFPGIVTALPITLQRLETPDVPVWRAVSAPPGPAVAGLLAAQRRLASLG